MGIGRSFGASVNALFVDGSPQFRNLILHVGSLASIRSSQSPRKGRLCLATDPLKISKHGKVFAAWNVCLCSFLLSF
jgi:hypothetical protein